MLETFFYYECDRKLNASRVFDEKTSPNLHHLLTHFNNEKIEKKVIFSKKL